MKNVTKAKSFYDQGLRFLHCAERCMGEINDDGSVQILGGKGQLLSTPVMVNSAFACELFLKTILILHEIDYIKCLKNAQRHKLKPLFDLLPSPEYKEFLQIGEKEVFEEELRIHSEDFVKWRYYMEKPGEYVMRPEFTYLFMHNLKILVQQIISKEEQKKESEGKYQLNKT